jgi:hypothetical protein
MSGVPLRAFGKADVKVSALGLGGHHLGAAKMNRPQLASYTTLWMVELLSTIAVGSTAVESQKTGWAKG